VRDHLVHIVRATHPDDEHAPAAIRQYVRSGSSPRGAQSMLAAARARALLQGRYHVSRKDIDAVAAPALSHRILLGFEGEAEGVHPADLIRAVVEAAP
jgi:MoxR-like ATPase